MDFIKNEILFPDYDDPDDVDKSEKGPDVTFLVVDVYWKIFANGIQHMAAVVFTVTLVPVLVMGAFNEDNETQTFVVSQSILMSGLSTIIQSHRFGCVGSNLLSVMGCSFAFLSVCISAGNLETVFGMTMTTAFFEPLLVYCMTPEWMDYIFPQWILGLAIMLIGFGLCGVGVGDWNGDGSRTDLAIGFWSMSSMILLYRFGNHTMRNVSVLLSLLSGYAFAVIIAAADDNYSIDTKSMDDADWWIWPHPGKFGFAWDGSMFLPFLIATMVSTLESIGDISATAALSGKVVQGQHFQRRLRGGLNADAFGSFLSCLFCSFPNTTYSENVGLVGITGVSDYRVGVAFGCIMIFLGFLGKFAGFFLSIPKPVIGGVLTVLFPMIAVSGFQLIVPHIHKKRVQFILACALGLGIGVSIQSAYGNNALGADITDKSSRIILDSGLTMGVLAAICLNIFMPEGLLENDDSKEDSGGILDSEKTNQAEIDLTSNSAHKDVGSNI